MSTPEGQEPTEEELRAALEEQMRNIRVDDVVLQTTATLVNLAGRKLGLASEPGTDPSGDVDLGEAKKAIDAARVLSPLCPEEQSAPIQQALSQLQMAYAQLAGPAGAGEQAAAPGQPEQPPAPEPPKQEEEKPPSRLWTPPGS